jgi:hypothetical protein
VAVCRNPKGATASANLYSLIETAKANGLNEYAYLKHIFTELPKVTCVEDFKKRLPWNIDPQSYFSTSVRTLVSLVNNKTMGII